MAAGIAGDIAGIGETAAAGIELESIGELMGAAAEVGDVAGVPMSAAPDVPLVEADGVTSEGLKLGAAVAMVASGLGPELTGVVSVLVSLFWQEQRSPADTMVARDIDRDFMDTPYFVHARRNARV